MKKEAENFLSLVTGIVFGAVGIFGFFTSIAKTPIPTLNVIGSIVLFALGIALLSRYEG